MHCCVEFLSHSITFDGPFLSSFLDGIGDFTRGIGGCATLRLKASDLITKFLFFGDPFCPRAFYRCRNLSLERNRGSLFRFSHELRRPLEVGEDLVSFGRPLRRGFGSALKLLTKFAVFRVEVRAHAFNGRRDLTLQGDSRAFLAVVELTAKLILFGEKLSPLLLPGNRSVVVRWIREGLSRAVGTVTVAIPQLAPKLVASRHKLGAFALP